MFIRKCIKALNNIKKYGIVPTFFYVLELLGTKYFKIDRFYFLYKKELDKFDEIKVDISNLRLEYDKFDLHKFKDLTKNFRDYFVFSVSFQNELEQGDTYMVYYLNNNDECIGISMIRFIKELHSVSGYKVTFNENEKPFLMYGAYVLPEYRGKGLAKYAIKEMIKYAARLGGTLAVAEVHYLNVPSLKLLKWAYFDVLKNILMVKILHWKHFFHLKRGIWC